MNGALETTRLEMRFLWKVAGTILREIDTRDSRNQSRAKKFHFENGHDLKIGGKFIFGEPRCLA